MAIRAAKCPSCGANLNIDEGRKKAFCEYCGSPFIVEDAINNFIGNNTVNVASVGTINVNSGQTADAKIQAGEAFLMLQKYQEAYDAFEEACKIRPQDYRGYWGKIRVITRDFTETDQKTIQLDSGQIFTLYNEMNVFLTVEEQKKYRMTIIRYYKSVQNNINNRLLNIDQTIRDKQDESQNIIMNIENNKNRIERSYNMKIIICIVFGILSLLGIFAISYSLANKIYALLPIFIMLTIVLIIIEISQLYIIKVMASDLERLSSKRNQEKQKQDNAENSIRESLNSQNKELEGIIDLYKYDLALSTHDC